MLFELYGTIDENLLFFLSICYMVSHGLTSPKKKSTIYFKLSMFSLLKSYYNIIAHAKAQIDHIR
jgi:hypothetical protein